LAWSFFFLTLAKLAQVATSAVLFMVMTRVMGREELNAFGLAVSLHNLFVIAVDFGVGEVVLRAAASDRTRIWGLFTAACRAKLLYVLIGVPLVTVIVLGVYDDPVTRAAVLIGIAAAVFRSYGEFVDAIPIALGRSQLVTLFALVQHGSLFAACLIVGVVMHGGAIALMVCFLVVMAVTAILRVGWLIVRCRRERLSGDRGIPTRRLLGESPLFGVTLLVGMLNGATLYPIVVSTVGSVKEDLAVLLAAQKFVGLPMAVAAMLGRSLFAAFSQDITRKDWVAVYQHIDRAQRILTIVLLGSCVTCLVCADEIIAWTYGGRFPDAALLLRMFSVIWVLQIPGFISGPILSAIHRQEVKMWVAVAAGVIAWPATYAATGWLGLPGTVGANIAVTAVTVVGFVVAQGRLFGRLPQPLRLWRCVVAAAGLVIFLVMARSVLPVIALLSSGALLYLVLLTVTGEWGAIFPSLPRPLGLKQWA